MDAGLITMWAKNPCKCHGNELLTAIAEVDD